MNGNGIFITAAIISDRYPLRSVRHSDESRRVDYGSITMVLITLFLIEHPLITALTTFAESRMCHSSTTTR